MVPILLRNSSNSSNLFPLFLTAAAAAAAPIQTELELPLQFGSMFGIECTEPEALAKVVAKQ